MKSPTNWAVLALVIERPSYAYELAQRFKRTYAGALSLSSASQIYSALDALTERALVEELAGSSEARQPKPHYRATERGLEEFEAWLIEQARELQRLQHLLTLQLLALRGLPRAERALDRYQQVWLEGPAPQVEDERSGEHSAGSTGLLEARRALIAEANVSWVKAARGELEHCRRREPDSE